MSGLDESRYGKATLLVLTVCPFTLRHVIDEYSIRRGCLSLQEFLDRNKQNLFHLYRKRCCCGFQQRGATPMNKGQWDLLYIRNGLSCITGQRGDCPCQYDAISGITTNVMDVTLCCLIINNICIGINLSHINTIREIRNKLIHADKAGLDEPTYRQYWSKVKAAVLDLAKNVPSTLYADTSKKIQDLENRLMNSDDLGELRKLIVDQKRFQDLESDISGVIQTVTTIDEQANKTAKKIAQIDVRAKKTTQKVTQIKSTTKLIAKNIVQAQRDISRVEKVIGDQCRENREWQEEKFRPIQQELSEHHRQIGEHGRQIEEHTRLIDIQKTQFHQELAEIKHHIPSSLVQDEQQYVSKVKQRLIKINNDITKAITMSPLQQRGENELPIELLYAQVVVFEDPKYREKGHGFTQHNREVVNPDDILMQNNEVVKKIYMLGDAAHGKTTYCIWLVKNWCSAQHGDPEGIKQLDHWEKALRKFDFVFLLQLRNVNRKRASMIDMICMDVFGDDRVCHLAIRHILSSEKYRSLVIMDGLDEWDPDEETRKQLTRQGMPNTEGISSTVSCFFSMRPWVFSTISKLVKVSDRVIEILGLSRTGMAKVIRNVLLNHYKLDERSPKYKDTYHKIERNLNDETMNSFMQIPLLAVVCVQIWYEGKQLGESMASFYAIMLNMLIERAYEKQDRPSEQYELVRCEMPEMLSDNESIENSISVLLKLGKVAYNGLLSNETSLIFQKRKLQKEIGVRELQFALDVGLISQKEAPSLLTKNVSVHFFHKSIQEFLAVIYIVSSKEVGDSFFLHLSNVKVFMQLSNVIKFICGMCPSLGSAVSQRFVSVTDNEPEICKYRESPRDGYRGICGDITLSWYKEFKYGLEDVGCSVTESSLKFYMSDIYLENESREFLSDNRVEIRSLYSACLPTNGEYGISNTELNSFLSNSQNTRSLVMVWMTGFNMDRFIHTICGPALRTLYLRYVEANVDTESIQLGCNVCPPFLSGMVSLRDLVLHDVTLGDRRLGLSAEMVNIEWIRLEYVNMSATGWTDFVISVQNMNL